MNGRKPSSLILPFKELPDLIQDSSIKTIQEAILKQLEDKKIKTNENTLGAISIGVKYALEKQKMMIYEALNAIKCEVAELESFASAGTKSSYIKVLQSERCPHYQKIRDIKITPSKGENHNLDVVIAFTGDPSEDENKFIEELKDYLYRDDIRPVCDFPNVILASKILLDVSVQLKYAENVSVEAVNERITKSFNDFVQEQKIDESIEYNNLLAKLYVDGVKNIKFINAPNRSLKRHLGHNILWPGQISFVQS